jgi:hypothetical protein
MDISFRPQEVRTKSDPPRVNYCVIPPFALQATSPTSIPYRLPQYKLILRLIYESDSPILACLPVVRSPSLRQGSHSFDTGRINIEYPGLVARSTQLRYIQV